jgi:predicted O-linked N-acetylglucosamine transferase (SPINDLY family)
MQAVTIPKTLELALRHHQSGRLAEAEAIYRQILAVEPRHADSLHLLGIIAHQTGRHDVAVNLIRQAIEVASGVANFYSSLGEAYRMQGDLDAAIAAYARAIEMEPGHAEAHNNLGIALARQRRLDEAILEYRCALTLKPEYVDAWNNLGNALTERGRLDEAVAAYGRALDLRPDDAKIHNNLGLALKEEGRLDAAIAFLRSAIALKEDSVTHSNLLLTLHYQPGLDAGTLHEEHLRWNQVHAQQLAGLIAPHSNDRDPERRLRVGYVSPDFCEHVAGRYLLPLLRCHDRERFEVICYSGVAQPDRMTERFHPFAARWRGILGVNDERVAEMVREDRVDILVDASQHMAGNRLPLFARQPAPVQVSFLGYPGGTAMDAIGNRISDRYLEGGSAREAYGSCERVALIDSFWCFDPSGLEVAVNELPAITGKAVTFGCLNNFCKVNERVLALWARVLGRVQGSRLVISSPSGNPRNWVRESLGRGGVEANRVEFVDLLPRREYLEIYHRLDLVLETFPYNGHTTSLDALWMGVPVVTLVGDLPVSRAGLSQLSNLGLPDLVAASEDEFVKIAADLAGDLPRLSGLRATLRQRMQASVLMDAPRFARQIEGAYREMWRAWCRASSGGAG